MGGQSAFFSYRNNIDLGTGHISTTPMENIPRRDVVLRVETDIVGQVTPRTLSHGPGTTELVILRE